MMENLEAIQLKNVTKVYQLYRNDKEHLRAVIFGNRGVREKRAIDNVSFSVKKGESVALFGRNGAGKSTVLKMITGVSYPTEGIIRVNGRVSALLELAAGFDPDLSGRENIFFRGEVMGIPRKEMKALEPKILEFADLGDYIDQPLRTYSSGMKARLGFAINANIRPDILIVDEALSVGDKNFRLKCKEKIREIMDEGVTFLFVTHSLSEAQNFCTRGLVLRHGQLVYDGDVHSAAEFYDHMTNNEMGR